MKLLSGLDTNRNKIWDGMGQGQKKLLSGACFYTATSIYRKFSGGQYTAAGKASSWDLLITDTEK